MKKSKITKLFKNMCCSVCHHDFDEDSIIIKREQEDLLVLQIVCPECGKSFGLALLGTGAESIKEEQDDEALTFQDCPQPINFDDVLDGHNFIDKLEKDWTKYIPEEYK
ncbi:hypothetical protein IJ182_05135 [bacterium]|nr:hypothetical protein [bacterium]